MATKLKNLSISKVAVVDEGANPDAHIRMMKRKDAEDQPADPGAGIHCQFPRTAERQQRYGI